MPVRGWVLASVRVALLALAVCLVSLTSLRTFSTIWLGVGPLLGVGIVSDCSAAGWWVEQRAGSLL